MKKAMLTLVALCCLAFASTASAALPKLTTTKASEPIVVVEDPTPGGTFTGEYQCGWEMEEDPDNPGQMRYKLDANGDRIPVMCQQTGYVSVGADGVVACNGNEEITRPDDGTPLQGYVWVGPGYAASNPTGAAPGNVAGAGNNHEDADGNHTGESPCP